MQADNLFHSAGEQIGRVLRLIIDGLSWFFRNIYGAIDSFYHGLTGELGINPSVFTLFMLIIGILLLLAAIRRLLSGRIFSAVIWAILGVFLLSWLVH